MATRTTVTMLVEDAGGIPATSGTVTFELQPKSGATLYYVQSTANIAPISVVGVINAVGVLKAADGTSALQLWGNDTITPSQTYYKVTVAPGGTVAQVVNLVLIHGTTYDMNAPQFYVPALIEPNTNPVQFQQVFSSLIPAYTDQYSVGSSDKKYASAYIDQLFGDSATLTGSLSVSRIIGGDNRGTVQMIHNSAGTWQIFKPDGTILSTPGTTTMGLMEGITYAKQNGFIFEAFGGGVPYGDTFNNHQITCTTPIAVPVGHGDGIYLRDCTILYRVDGGGGADPTKAFFTFDSADFSTFIHTGEIVYQGDAVAIDFNPQTNNGEDFAGFAEGNYEFGSVVCFPSVAHPTPISSICRVRTPHLGLGLPNGDGLFTGTNLTIKEANGGVSALIVDDPGSGNVFSLNEIEISAHSQTGIGIKGGTSATSAGRIYGNQWNVTMSGSGTKAVSVWGGASAGGDLWNLISGGFAYGIAFETSAVNQIVNAGYLAGTTAAILNNATSQTNKVNAPLGFNRAVVSVGASPYAYQNLKCVPITAIVSGGTVSILRQSADGSAFDTTGLTAGSFVIWPGHYLQITHAGAPTMTVQY